MRAVPVVITSLAVMTTGVMLPMAAQGDVDPSTKARAVTMAGGADHIVLIDGAGALWRSQSAAGQVTPWNVLPAGKRAARVDVGPAGTAVIDADGAAYAVTGSSARPLSGLPSGVRASHVAVGAALWIVGNDGVLYTASDSSSALRASAGISASVTQVDAGGYGTLALDQSGQVWRAAAGASTFARVGGLPDGSKAVSVASGASEAAVVLADRRLVVLSDLAADGTPRIINGGGWRGVGAYATGQSVYALNNDGSVYSLTPSGGAAVALAEPAQSDAVGFDKAVEVAAGGTFAVVRDARGVTYHSASTGSGLAMVGQHPFAATSPPQILNGTAADAGDTLSAQAADWSPESLGTSTWQWLRDGRPIDGATSPQYTVTRADLNTSLSVRQTRGMQGMTTETATSAAVPVGPQPLQVVSAASIRGNGTVGSVLTGTDATFDGGVEQTSRVWLRDGVQIAGASELTYKLTRADAGRSISMRTTGRRVGSQPGTSQSRAIKVAIANLAKPTVRGTARVGRTVKATRGTWAGASSYSYQWFAGSKKIKGATRASFKIRPQQAKSRLSVRVSAKRPGFATVTVASAATARVRR